MCYSNNQLQELFQAKFNLKEWQNFLHNFFGATDLESEPKKLNELTENECCLYLGKLYTSDNFEIGFLYFQLTSGSVKRKKTGLRKLTQSYMTSFDSVLAVFDDGQSWRFSLVCDLKSLETSPKRFSFVFGDSSQLYRTPVSRFVELAQDGISFRTIKKAFSVEALSEQFYKELFVWYEWALNPATRVLFPNYPLSIPEEKKALEEKIIRLITRLMFVWFIKQKKLIPNSLFEIDSLKLLLKDFNPYSSENGNYYNGILQNLFFATLNNSICKRQFATDERDENNVASDYSIKTLFRNPKNDTWFLVSNDEVLKIFSKVPFLNGGLFECLDKWPNQESRHIVYYDGFSREPARMAFLPNCLFFGTKENPDCGLIPLLQRYNFTIEENSTNDAAVALDPELLGKVFENLLGAFNPETMESARKKSGSFYTPREIVNYMVDASLKAYLYNSEKSDDIDRLFDEEDLSQELMHNEQGRKRITAKLKQIKILDPACGSGAFPMGELTRIVSLLKKLDPDDKETLYEQKLHLIENCIYGIDIQNIAVQISKLRFFISLVCEQTPNLDDPDNNYGINPLPNLETKFVSANSLIRINKKEEPNLFEDPQIQETKNRLHDIRHKHFCSQSYLEKKQFREEDRKNREILVSLLKENKNCAPMDAKLLASWNPYDQNTSSCFFDPEWMFGETEGFDIIIGNPPYIQLQKNNGELGKFYEDCNYKTFKKTGDISCLFLERGNELLKPNGHLCYITSNKYLRSGYGEATRDYLANHTNPKLLVDLGPNVFTSATVDTCIILFQKAKNRGETKACTAGVECRDNLSLYIEQHAIICKFINCSSWIIMNSVEQIIKEKIERIGTPLRNWNIKIYRGILTGCNEAFIINEATKRELIAEDPKSEEIIRPILRGRDIQHNTFKWSGLYLIASHNGIPDKKIPKVNIEDYPAIKKHLDKYYKEISSRTDKGDTPYNLRSCAYWDDFSKPKIAWGNLSLQSAFSEIPPQYFLNAPSPMIVPFNPYILAILNSRIGDWYIRKLGVSRNGGYFEYKPMFVEKLPVPNIPIAQQTQFLALVKSNPLDYETLVASLYKLTPLEQTYLGI